MLTPDLDKIEFNAFNHSELLPMQATGVTLELGERRLVKDIDLSLPDGKFTVLMGANGAGKSLLLRLLHGLHHPTVGTIRWGGVAINDEIRRRQAMVFQKSVLLRRSVKANMDFVLGLTGKVNQEKRDQLLDQVGLLSRSKQPARLLSGGEQQRLALARALATNPRVLFLDEATASLDPASTLMIEEVVTAAYRNGIKVLFITHDLGQARRLADEVVFLHRGRLVEHSDAKQFFSNPTAEAAQAYLDGRILV